MDVLRIGETTRRVSGTVPHIKWGCKLAGRLREHPDRAGGEEADCIKEREAVPAEPRAEVLGGAWWLGCLHVFVSQQPGPVHRVTLPPGSVNWQAGPRQSRGCVHGGERLADPRVPALPRQRGSLTSSLLTGWLCRHF